MNAFIFSLDGKNFCQFMTPNPPQPYVFGPFPPGAGGAFIFWIFKNDTWPWDRPTWAWDRPTRALDMPTWAMDGPTWAMDRPTWARDRRPTVAQVAPP